jgi:hypothetical protein
MIALNPDRRTEAEADLPLHVKYQTGLPAGYPTRRDQAMRALLLRAAMEIHGTVRINEDHAGAGRRVAAHRRRFRAQTTGSRKGRGAPAAN